MKKEDTQRENETATVIEDLTVSESESERVNGGAVVKGGTLDNFSFGVEREMKE